MGTSSWPRISWTGPRTRVFGYAAFALTYTVVIFAGRHLTLYEGTGPPVAWPAAGLLFAGFLITPPASWLLLSLISGACITVAHLLSHIPPINVPIIVASVCLPSAFGAWLLGRIERRGAPDERDEDVSATALVIVGGFVVPAIVATCFACLSAYRDTSVGRLYFTSGDEHWLGVWRDHFAGPSLGILTITPFVIALDRARRSRVRVRPRAMVGDLTILAATCAIAACFFEVSGLPLEVRSPSIIMPIIVLISLRGKMTLTTAANLIVSWVMIGATLRGHGPFAAFFDSPLARTTVLQIFVAINVFSQTLFTAIIAGRSRLAASFRARGEELERLNEDLNRAKEEALRASAAKTRLLADVTHEIRTPLGAMIGFADLALDEKPPEKKDEYIEIVRRNGVRLNEFIDHSLDLAKIDAGRFQIDPQPVDVRELTAEVCDLMQVKAREKKVSLVVEHAPRLPKDFCTDSLRLRQILMNLIGNAIKFTNVGRITVRVTSFRESDRRRLTFEVSDTGVGLTPAQRRHLFEPYHQASAGTAREFGGTGLGLNLSRELARLLAGDVVLASAEPGRGTTFRVYLDELPAARAATASASPSRSSHAADTPSP